MAAKRPARPGVEPVRAGRVPAAGTKAKSAKTAVEGKADVKAKANVKAKAAKVAAKKPVAKKTNSPRKTVAKNTGAKKTGARKAATKPAARSMAKSVATSRIASDSQSVTKSARAKPRAKQIIRAVASDPGEAPAERVVRSNSKAAVAARRQTLDQVTFHGDLRSVPVDPGDPVGIDLREQQIARQDAAAAAAELAARPRPRRKRTVVERLDDPAPAAGLVLIDRLTRSIERELCAIEKIVDIRLAKGVRTETERRARTLASLARTLAEVRKMRSDEARKGPLDDDTIPRDLDELRRALSRRLEQMVDSRAQLPAAGDE